MLGSFSALIHAQRMRESPGKNSFFWMLAGATTLGLSIWSMHFIGMLAWHLPIQVKYDTTLTLLSILPAIGAALIGFRVLRHTTISASQLLFSSVWMGIAISAMHYLGMAALQMSPPIQYDSGIFALSVLIAILASWGALLLMYHGHRIELPAQLRFALSALIMGIAISGMHYTAMQGLHLAPESLCRAEGANIDNALLATLVTAIVLLWSGGGLLASLFDHMVSRQAIKALAKLQKEHRDLQFQTTQQTNVMLNTLRDREERLSMLMRHAPDAVFIFENTGSITFANEQAGLLLGYRREELQNMNFFDLAPKEWRAVYREQAQEIMLDHDRHVLEMRLLNQQGQRIPIELSAILLPNDQVYGSCRDIRERKAVLRALKDSQENMQNLLNSMAEGMYGVDNGGICTFVNPAFLNMLGYDHSDEVIGKPIHRLVHHSYPDGSPYPGRECRMYLAYQARQKIHVDDEVFWRKNGQPVPVEYWSHPIIKNNHVIGSVVTFLDITERKRAEESLRESEEYARTALEELNYQKFALDQHSIVAITDINGTITYVNQKFCDISGYSQTELLGENHRILSSGYHSKEFFRDMYQTIASGSVWRGEICNRHKNGELYWLITTIVPYLNEHGKPTQYISMRTDITQRKAAESRVHQLAFYDALTNLPNRRLLLDRLRQAIVVSERTQQYGAVLFLDLDRFKTLNDSQGHDIGDLLLTEVATRLQHSVREEDIVSRLGGDEFVVVMENLGDHDHQAASHAENIAENIRRALNRAYRLKDLVHHTTPSIGITLFLGQQHSMEDLLKHADIAMYQSKMAGRNTIRFYEPAMQTALNQRITLERELRQALARQQFELYYQVQIDDQYRPFGAEVLIRWYHPKRGMISPGEFVPILEETELIIPIGLWILRSACTQISYWQNDPLTRHLELSVNISAKQFRQADFVPQLQAILQETGVHPDKLKLELTESMVLDHVDEAIAKMHALRAIGVRFSMDDFGTGYSSLQYLKLLPLNQIKIDQSFVRDISTDPNDAAIVQAIIAIAKALQLDVIAEGVETLQQQALLKQYGCHTFQGHLYGHAMPLYEFEARLHAITARTVNATPDWPLGATIPPQEIRP